MLNQVSVFLFLPCMRGNASAYLSVYFILFYFIFCFARFFFFEELLFVGCHLLKFSFLNNPFMFALKKSAFV